MSYSLTDGEKEKIDEAYATVMKAFDRYTSVLNFKDATMQPGLLLCAVSSWILDEDRHAEFHPCKVLEKYKRAAYFIHWFIRIKPIQLLTKGYPGAHGVLINENFALFMAYRILGISKAGAIPAGFTKEMLYGLRYRESCPESLFTTMNLLEISAKSGELRKIYDAK